MKTEEIYEKIIARFRVFLIDQIKEGHEPGFDSREDFFLFAAKSFFEQNDLEKPERAALYDLVCEDAMPKSVKDRLNKIAVENASLYEFHDDALAATKLAIEGWDDEA